jgi:hypothetical protein
LLLVLEITINSKDFILPDNIINVVLKKVVGVQGTVELCQKIKAEFDRTADLSYINNKKINIFLIHLFADSKKLVSLSRSY